MSTGLQVTIFPTHVRVPNGLGSFKNVSIHDFHQEISRVATGGEQVSQPKVSFRLPSEAVSVRYNLHEIDVLMYFPETKREIRHNSSKYTIPFPNTVVFASLKSNGKNGWALERVKWLCTDYKEDEVPNLDKWEITPSQYSNHLWPLPFPNQYGDGGMCVGHNSYRSLYTNDLRGLNELFYHILVASPFNDDIWHRGAAGLRYEGSNAQGWFKILARLNEFPYDRLGGYPRTAPAAPAIPEEGNDDEDE